MRIVSTPPVTLVSGEIRVEGTPMASAALNEEAAIAMVCVPSCERASSPYQSHVGPFSFPDLPQRDRSKSVQPGLNPRMCVTLRPGWKRNATGLLVPVVMGTVNLCRVLMSSRRVGVVKGRPRFISLRTDRNLP